MNTKEKQIGMELIKKLFVVLTWIFIILPLAFLTGLLMIIVAIPLWIFTKKDLDRSIHTIPLCNSFWEFACFWTELMYK